MGRLQEHDFHYCVCFTTILYIYMLKIYYSVIFSRQLAKGIDSEPDAIKEQVGDILLRDIDM